MYMCMYTFIVLHARRLCRADILINTAQLPNVDDGQISEDPQYTDILHNPALLVCPYHGRFSEVPLY